MSKRAFSILFLCFVMNLFLCSCSRHSSDLDQVDPTNLAQLENLYGGTYIKMKGTAGNRGVRLQALKETAMSLGARGGLTFASERIND